MTFLSQLYILINLLLGNWLLIVKQSIVKESVKNDKLLTGKE